MKFGGSKYFQPTTFVVKSEIDLKKEKKLISFSKIIAKNI